MLTRLFIRDFALIEKAEIEFGDGLNVITGETGAGKSILLGALYSILGGPTNGDLVREGAERCVVEGLMEFDKHNGLVERLREIDVECEEGQLFLRREILDNGRSRAYVNGSGSPIKKLRQIGSLLVDLHGQHEHQSLLDAHLHIHYLDAFGRLETKTHEVAQSWRAMRADEQTLSDLQDRRQRLLVDGELRAFQLAEIQELSPQVGEEETLETELQVLENVHNLVQLGEEIHDLLYQRDGSVYEQLSQVRRRLDRITGIDPSLLEQAKSLEEISYLVEDVAQTMRTYGRALDADPAQAEQIRERVEALRSLKRKYGPSLADVLAYGEELERSENQTAELDQQIDRVRAQLEANEQHFAERCAELSAGRKRAADALETAIARSLKDLGIEHGQFSVQLTPRAEAANERGAEQVAFYINTNLGSELRPLARVASGGEVSRIMLSIKEAIAERDLISVLVFDEVDSGVSGRIAAAVGRKLKALAGSHQTIVITHLPQIASLADRHFAVRKDKDSTRTTTHVQQLDKEGRTEEIAYLLAGETVSETARQHARELIR
ncbi:MAG: DNA repair protein RecN [Candidatus Latescibacterota bacterium]|nr:DNA repair protein RecN [Candidatus Latescibacterota bacterium]